MKTYSLLFTSFAFAALLSADVVDVSSKIDSVTVYQGVAKVTRTFEVELPANAAATLRFSGLPETINPSFVQVAATEGAALSLGLANFESEFTDAQRSEFLRDLDDKLSALDAKKAAMQNDRDALDAFAKSRASLVDSINNGLARNGTQYLYELSKTSNDEAAAAAKDSFVKRAAIDIELRKIERDITAAKDAVVKQANREKATCGKYSVEAVSAGDKTKGTITYYVPGPTWEPSYIVRADTAKGAVAIHMLAKVTQLTGEDWKDVNLFLETTKPGAGAKPEEPPVAYLKKQEYVRAYASKSSYIETDTLAGARLREAPIPVELDPLSINAAATSTGFRAQIPGRVTVASPNADNLQPTVLPLLEKDAACEFHSETIPVSAETAFLVGKLKNPFPLPMLAGTMQAVVDGSTNGEGAIEETLPGDEITIGLGTNQNVAIERKTVSEKGGNSGIFGGKRVEKRSYTTKITNHMTVAQRVIIRDSVPISKDAKIIVEIQKPDDAKVDPEKGLFDREVTLKPGESKELPTIYTVTYPSDWKINSEF